MIWFIIKRLGPCSADFVPLRRANKQWDLLIQQKKREMPKEFPRLLLPSSTEILFHSMTACELNEDPGVQCEWHQLRVPDDVRNSRICGSSDGGWLALSMENPYRVVFFNICTRETIPLPTTIDLLYQYKETPTVTVKAMVGSWLSPTAVDVVAAIVETDMTGEMITPWRDPLPHWQHVVCPNEPRDTLQDVIHFRNGFYFLTLEENLGIVEPEIEDDGMVWGNWEEVPIREMEFEIQARKGKFLTRRYLIESKGQLFSVSKLINENSDSHRTLKLIVYRLRKDVPSSSSDDDEQSQDSEDVKNFEEEEEEAFQANEPNISSNSEDDEQYQDSEDESNFEEEEEEAFQANKPNSSSSSSEADEQSHDSEDEKNFEEEEEEAFQAKEPNSRREADKQHYQDMQGNQTLEEEVEEEEEEEEPPQSFRWTDASWLHEVQDRVFFIGQASSRSFAWQNREARIYFYDDDWLQCAETGEYIRENMGFVSMHALMEVESPVMRPVVGEHPLPKPTSDKFPPGWWIP